MRTVCTAAAMLAAALSVASPAAADESAIVTIGGLEAQGYTVHVDRIGSAPLDRCVVTDVRNPQQVTRFIRVEDGGWANHDDGEDLVEVVVGQSISVSLDCTA